MASGALLRCDGNPSDTRIRAAHAGDLCRCTGCMKIIASVQPGAGARP